jgi:hypothetical protein
MPSSRRVLLLLRVLIATVAIAALASVTAATQSKSAEFEECLAITDTTARLRCFDSAATKLRQQQVPASRDSGAWKLIRSADPRGGPEAVAIMRTADISKSDADFAGLMLRCATNGIEVVVVVLEPRSPRAHPHIKIGVPSKEAQYEATVVPPFTALLLPQDVSAQAAGPWLSAAELSIEVDGERAIHGIVALGGLRKALDDLRTSCPASGSAMPRPN